MSVGGYGNGGRASGTDVVRSHGVNFLDLIAEGDGLVDDELDKLVGSGLSGQQFELLVDRASPRDNDKQRDLRNS